MRQYAEAFDRYYAERFGVLVGQVYAMCGNAAEASDCVQEAFVKAWGRREQFGAMANKDAWIRTVARNLTVSAWRRHRREVALSAEPLARVPDAAARRSLHRALRTLPDNHRHAIVLHYLVDLPVADVATELNSSEGTVRVWLSRGRARLAELLDDKETNHA